MSKVGEIIAIGGGGFGRNPNNPIIEKYIVDQSEKEKPNVCFIPTASAEDKQYTVNYYTAFTQLSCNPIHINFFSGHPDWTLLLTSRTLFMWVAATPNPCWQSGENGNWINYC